MNASIVSQRGAGNESSVVQDGFANDFWFTAWSGEPRCRDAVERREQALVAQIGAERVVYQDSELSGGVATLFQLGTANEGTITSEWDWRCPGSTAMHSPDRNANSPPGAERHSSLASDRDIIQYGDRNEARQLQLNVGDIGGNHLDALRSASGHSQQVQSGTAGPHRRRGAGRQQQQRWAARRTQHNNPVAVAIIAQVGEANEAEQYQEGSADMLALAIQWGTDNFAQYSQVASGNVLAASLQLGEANEAYIAQYDAGYHTALSLQVGTANLVAIQQSGDGDNFALAVQLGTNNTAVVTQQAGTTI